MEAHKTTGRLMLKRKVGERIVIADTIVIEVHEVGQGCVRLGIVAPRDVPIVRGELVEVVSNGNR